MQQNNAAAATALYDGALPTNDAGDAVMARWLQSAGLQHLASPVASTGNDQRHLPNLLMQGYGAQTAEEKQRLFQLMRNLNFNGESTSESYTPTAHTSAAMPSSEGFFSPEFRGDFGAGLLDLHAMDDTELLSEVCLEEELVQRLIHSYSLVPMDNRKIINFHHQIVCSCVTSQFSNCSCQSYIAILSPT
jgi:kinesin family protein 2/24